VEVVGSRALTTKKGVGWSWRQERATRGSIWELAAVEETERCLQMGREQATVYSIQTLLPDRSVAGILHLSVVVCVWFWEWIINVL
jgi:hypothetical protein